MRYLLTFILIITSATSRSQSNYTGNYGYTESHKDFIRRRPEAKYGESGFQCNLILLRLHDNEYKFWLYIMKGYSNYNSGHTEGIIHVVHDSAVYFEKDSELLINCKLIFSFYKKKISIDDLTMNCGFGANVFAEGDYPLKSKATPTIKDIARTYQGDIDAYKIIIPQSKIYKKPDSLSISKQYFVKNDIVYVFEEENNFVYIQFITKNGKYIEGWIKKSDVELN